MRHGAKFANWRVRPLTPALSPEYRGEGENALAPVVAGDAHPTLNASAVSGRKRICCARLTA